MPVVVAIGAVGGISGLITGGAAVGGAVLATKVLAEPLKELGQDMVKITADEVDRQATKFVEKVESTGRNIEKRVDALLGSGDYDEASGMERFRVAFLGMHDEGAGLNSEKDTLEKGDVIAVSRGAYEHFGIYVGNSRVIHYWSRSSDIGNNKISETSFEDFLRGESRYFTLDFPKNRGKPRRIVLNNGFINSEVYDFDINEYFKDKRYKLYSASETIERARARVGEAQYTLWGNNCEHFAIWCKTGVAESHQVNDICRRILLQKTLV